MRLLVIGLLISSLFILGCNSSPDYTDFAKCLTAEGMTFYGAFWCPHCQEMKQKFGDAMKYVQYVECDGRDPKGQPQVCEEKGIEGFPTFIFKDDARLVGAQPLSELAAETGCEVPHGN